ncbi:MAG: TrkA C-terminal domain-containing protein, partial [Candidatus Margulisiibacteriota bacterium]
FLTITAKQLNPKIRIISKIMNLENKRKLIRAGATSIVPPQFIGALRLVSEMVRPKVVGFLDNMLRDKKNLRIEEITIPKNSWTIGKELQELDLRKKIGLQVIAFQDPISQAYNYAPKFDDKIQENMIIITMGEPDQIIKLEKFIQ